MVNLISKMKKIIVLFALCVVGNVFGQKSVNSPYSYYGLGETRFGGNTENMLMGGVSSFADSTRVDVRNPASLGKLLLTAFSFGYTNDFRTLKTNESSQRVSTSAVDYVALSFPVYKNFGVSVGLSPYSSVGYKLASIQPDLVQTLEGKGNLNRVYLATGYQIVKGLRLGAGMYFNFGKTEINNFSKPSDALYTTGEYSSSIYRGVNFNFGSQYDYKISNRLFATFSLAYTSQSTIKSTNSRTLSVLQNTDSGTIVKDTQSVNLGELAKTDLVIPSQFTFGLGIGNQTKWFIGVDYSVVNNDEFSNPFMSSGIVSYEKGYKYAIGGFFVPQMSSFTNYWKRVTYRAGFYYENTGITLNNEKINDFGMSFGVSLPVRGVSNVSVGALLGSKGTKNQNLVKENYIGLKIGFTLNDKWFQKSKYN